MKHIPYVYKGEKLQVVRYNPDNYVIIGVYRQNRTRWNYLEKPGTYSELFKYMENGLYDGVFLETGEKYITNNPDLQVVYYAIQDKGKMAYLPAKKVDKYDGTEEYLLKHGKMLGYNKFCEKFHTCYFPEPMNIVLQVEQDICGVYCENEKIGSCMTAETDLVNYYEEMGCNILTARNDGVLYGRAIIWNNPILVSGKKEYHQLLDRCYAVSNELKEKMRLFAQDKGMDIRESDEPYFSPFQSGNKYKIRSNRDTDIPWLDTMRHYEDGFINNFSGAICQSCSGTNIPETCTCYQCGCRISEEDAIELNGEYYCNDCVVYSDHYGEYLLENEAVYCEDVESYVLDNDDEFVNVNGRLYYTQGDRITYDDINDCYIMMEDSVYCEDTGNTTDRDTAYFCDECEKWFESELTEKDGKYLCEECLQLVEAE